MVILKGWLAAPAILQVNMVTGTLSVLVLFGINGPNFPIAIPIGNRWLERRIRLNGQVVLKAVLVKCGTLRRPIGCFLQRKHLRGHKGFVSRAATVLFARGPVQTVKKGVPPLAAIASHPPLGIPTTL